jgi:predicted protein tyrosine phosphatase
LAIVAAIVLGARPADIFEELAPYRAALRPNRRVLSLADGSARLVGGSLVADATRTFAAGYRRSRLVELRGIVEVQGAPTAELLEEMHG